MNYNYGTVSSGAILVPSHTYPLLPRAAAHEGHPPSPTMTQPPLPSAHLRLRSPSPWEPKTV